MFEYFKLKAELQDYKDAGIALVNEHRELRNKVQDLEGRIAQYKEIEQQRQEAKEEHKQKMIAALEDQFLTNPSNVLLDAIKYYKGSSNLYAQYSPNNQALMQAVGRYSY